MVYRNEAGGVVSAIPYESMGCYIYKAQQYINNMHPLQDSMNLQLQLQLQAVWFFELSNLKFRVAT